MICGKVADDIHHIIYRSQGGGDEKSNLLPLCRFHHNQVHGGNIVLRKEGSNLRVFIKGTDGELRLSKTIFL